MKLSILFVTTSEHMWLLILYIIVELIRLTINYYLIIAEDEDEEKEELPKVETQTQLERWEMSLMACTSFSQLFLHFSTLG
jgi:hypothetical protein